MKKVLLTIIIAFFATISFAQSSNYHVSASTLNMRSEPTTDSEIVTKLDRYDNLELKNDSIPNWYQVEFEGKTGYVYKTYVSEGKAVVSTYSVRTGAKCKDGTTSSATGRGACSHHGGVAYWLTSNKQNVQIIK